jgi:DNA-binding CsgD family transcriptional regulator/N-acetylneuraminic acid mutarotase
MSDHQSPLELSEREIQVLQLVVTGASNQEIARQLVISPNTVKVHLRNIFSKLGVQSRTEATLRAIQEGLVTVTENGASVVEAHEAGSPPPARTYLLEPKLPQVLPRWQQIYLFAVILITLSLATLPLFPGEAKTIPPPLPILYPRPTPIPPVQSRTSSTRWITHTPLPGRRAGLALASFNQQLFAIGGVKDNNQATRLVEIYNPETEVWSEGTSKPTATTDISGAILNGKIYIPGGCTDRGKAVNTLEIYDPESDSWTEGASLPEGRCGYGLVAFQGKLYLFGGWNGDSFEDTIFTFTPEKDNWAVLEQKMPQPLGYIGAAALDDAIYIVGGYDGENEFGATYAFTPGTGAWQEKSPLHERRGGLGLVSHNQNLYAIGGGWTRALSHAEKYDPATDTWTNIEMPLVGQWRNLGLTVMDTTIYAAGGWNGAEEEFMDSVVSYQLLFQIFLPISAGSR